jgi:hypothetical protein
MRDRGGLISASSWAGRNRFDGTDVGMNPHGLRMLFKDII